MGVNSRALLNRRTILRGLAAVATSGATSVAAEPKASHETIKEAAARRGVLFGSSFDQFVDWEPAYANLLREECSILTTDYSLKFGAIREKPGPASFEKPDKLVTFAERAGLPVRGHNLIWNEWLPDWVKRLSKKETSLLFERHIEEVVAHYAGRIQSWDVVNEPIWPGHHNPWGLRGGPWYAAIGPDYIARAFRITRSIDPQAKLVLNDAGMDWPGELGIEIRQDLLRLVKDLLDQGVPLDVLGFELHLKAVDGYDRGPFLEFVQAVHDLKIDMYITELDVDDSRLPDDIQVRDAMVADCYRTYLVDMLGYPSLKVISTWELADGFSYMASDVNGMNARRPRPLPFDLDLKRKPAYDAILDALRQA